jgi:hypothetical protein
MDTPAAPARRLGRVTPAADRRLDNERTAATLDEAAHFARRHLAFDAAFE